MRITDLPPELLGHIHNSIEPHSVASLAFSLTCRQFRAASEAPPNTPRRTAVGDYSELRVPSVCEWAVATCGLPLRSELCEVVALQRGNLPVLQWLRARGCPWDATTCESAATCGDIDMLKWAKQAGCPWNDWTCLAAAFEGHIPILQYAHKHKLRIGLRAACSAASGGQVKVLQWIRCNTLDVMPHHTTTSLCDYAAKKGQLKVVKWLVRTKNSRYGQKTIEKAAKKGHMHVVAWLSRI